jgi:N utilization substance protein A
MVIDELAGERIDIVRFDEEPMNMIPNALQPAEVDEVILCPMMGRAIVLVREDQLSLAIGKRGQNVRLASKLCTWDIEIMTQDELEQQIARAVQGFLKVEGVDEELANRLVGEGYLSYDDLSVIEPPDLMTMGWLTEEQVDAIVDQADVLAQEAEIREAEEKRAKKAAAAVAAEEARRAEAAAKIAQEAAAKEEAAKPATEEVDGSAESSGQPESNPGGESTDSDKPAE